MKRISIAIATALFAAGGANAASIVLTATLPLNVSGSVSTVTATLTILPGGETVPSFSAYGVQVGWNNAVVRVVGSNGTTTFGKSSQSSIIPGLSGSLTPSCVSAGVNKGKACTVITQANAGAPVFVPGGLVVIGTLLLEVLPPPGGPDPIGTSLGLSITSYNNNGITNPLADPDLFIDSSFGGGFVIPEPSTAALLTLGVLGLGVGARRRT